MLKFYEAPLMLHEDGIPLLASRQIHVSYYYILLLGSCFLRCITFHVKCASILANSVAFPVKFVVQLISFMTLSPIF